MIHLLTPPAFDDEDKTLVAHHLFIILWTLMAVGGLTILIAFIIPETVYRWLLVVGIIEISGLTLLALNRRGHTRLASHLMMIIIWALATGMALTGGGISSNAMALYLVIVLIAGLLQSGKAAMITAALCSLTGLFLVYLQHSGALPANQVPHTPLTLWISNTVYMFIIICLQYLVSRTVRKALKRSREELKERQRVEAALRDGEELHTKLIATVPDIIVRTNLNGEILFINDGGLQLGGYHEKELIGQSMLSFIAPEDRDKAVRNTLLMFEKRLGPQEYHLLMRNGEKLLFEVNGDVLRNEDGSPYGLVQVCRDITERKRTEEENRRLVERLQRAEKMEALGQLAGGVAHDLNNVLGILSGYSELLMMEIPKESRARGHVEKILQSTEKGAAIIQDLLTLARRGVTASDVINLNDIVSGFLESPAFEKMKEHLPRLTFRTECDRNLLNIKGSTAHLEKTLTNLVSNAAESISGKERGEVTIRTESRYLDQAVRGYDEIREGDYTILTVSDTGMGIPAENREKIFEPFYTKKTMGRSGTGLGLAIVWGTVKDHDGYIDVETAEGEGTTFTLYFPATREELAARQHNESMEHYAGHGESVLVVDDVSEQRAVASRVLTRLGYRVHTVPGGEEAVEYLKGNKADILVLDMIMEPGIDGLETYRRVREINPQQKAIIVSGFSETERVKEVQELGAGAYIRKPYTMERIGRAVRDELIREPGNDSRKRPLPKDE